MDFLYLVAAGLAWAAILGLACACQRLQPSQVKP